MSKPFFINGEKLVGKKRSMVEKYCSHKFHAFKKKNLY